MTHIALTAKRIHMLSVFVLVVLSTALLAQNIPPLKETVPAETEQIGTFDVRQISFTPWNNESLKFREYEDGFMGLYSFQVLDEDRIAFLLEGRITVIGRQNGRVLSSFSFSPDAKDFIYENGKFYILSQEFSIDIYDESGKLLKSVPFERNEDNYAFNIVRQNNSTYIQTSKIEHDDIADPHFLIKPIVTVFSRPVEKNGLPVNGEKEKLPFYPGLTVDQENSAGICSVIITNKEGRTFNRSFPKDSDCYVIGMTNNTVIFGIDNTLPDQSPNGHKNRIQSVEFNSERGFGNISAEIVMPHASFDPYVRSKKEFYFSQGGALYQMLTTEDGIFIFELKETKLGVPHSSYPASLNTEK